MDDDYWIISYAKLLLLAVVCMYDIIGGGGGLLSNCEKAHGEPRLTPNMYYLTIFERGVSEPILYLK